MCRSYSCFNNGRCRMKNDQNRDKFSPECVCNKRFNGDRCEFKVNACVTNPCNNLLNSDSVCVPTNDGSFQCVCSRRFEGKYCSIAGELRRPFVSSFNGSSYIEKPGLTLDFKSIEIVFLTRKMNGLLLYNHQNNSNDFFSIRIENGFLLVELNLNNKTDILM